jgi:hypothetical protein
MAFWQFAAVPQQWPDVLYTLVTDDKENTVFLCCHSNFVHEICPCKLLRVLLVKEVVKGCRLHSLEEVQMSTTESLKETTELFPAKVPLAKCVTTEGGFFESGIR